MNEKYTPADWEELVKTYGGLVYTIVMNKLNRCASREDIEDCVSDIFVELHRSMDSFSNEKGDMKAFITSIAKRRAIDAFRRISYRSSITDSLDDEDSAAVLPSAPDDTAGEAEKRILRRKLWDAVKSLGEPDSSIILYQYFYNMKVREIAEKLSMSAAAVQKRSLRARNKIREMLEKE